ncbi:MAG TPA: hypothetical protein VMZ26_15745 [Pyrinomonadaceae bacterium]|nr:hypothetical protein [Pyrinomonadaceae bacterium]
MPDDDATLVAEGGKKVTITIAEKTGSATAQASDSVDAIESDTFVIDNGKKILTITIAE